MKKASIVKRLLSPEARSVKGLEYADWMYLKAGPNGSALRAASGLF
jgi:hypothetical protein